MKRTTAALSGLALALSASPSMAQTSYSDLDHGNDLQLSQAEFDNTFGRDLFAAWDTDSNRNIDEDEFYRGVFDLFDADGDGTLSLSEYDDGWSGWFNTQNYVGFTELEADGDGVLAVEEFRAGLAATDLYERWTYDGALGEEEFTTAIFSIYDVDSDGMLTQEEFREIIYRASDGDGAGVPPAETLQVNEVVSLSQWDYEDLYVDGVSAEEFIDKMVVYAMSGEPIGQVEDLILGADGEVLSVIVDVGGLWDIGDTHASIPWSDIQMSSNRDGIIVPVTEDTVDEYGYFGELGTGRITAAEAGTAIISEVDDAATGRRAWRVTEIIGDYARLGDEASYRNYGYVNDIILKNGEVAAVIIEPDPDYGYDGYQAYPFYGYDADYGWSPGNNYYDLPYDETEVRSVRPFVYDRLGG